MLWVSGMFDDVFVNAVAFMVHFSNTTAFTDDGDNFPRLTETTETPCFTLKVHEVATVITELSHDSPLHP